MIRTRSESYLQSVLIAVVAVLVLYPVAWILFISLTRGGAFSIQSYVQLFSERSLLSSFANSIGVSVAASVIALLFGVPLAFIAVRTDLKYRGLIALFAMIPFITPAFIGGLAWTVLGAPRTGLLNVAGQWLGLGGPWLNMYSLSGMVFTLGVYMSPYVFVLTSAVLGAIDPTLEEAAAVSGSRAPDIIRSVVLPLAIPGIAAAALVAFLNSAEQFGIPAILGRPANIFVLPTEIYSLMNRLPPDTSQASSAAILLLALSTIPITLQRRLLERRSYVTVTGKGFRQRRFALGRWRYAAYAIVVSYAMVAVVLPIAALGLSSVLAAGTFSLAGNTLTLQHYVYLFTAYPATTRSLINGFIYSVIGSTVALALAALSAYFIARHRSALTSTLRALILFPLVLPGIVIGTGLLLAYIRPPLLLYGTLWILVVSYITRFLPFGEQASSAALQQIDPSLEDASSVCGAGWFTTWRTVLLPLIRPALVGAWILLFVSMMRELGTSVLLYSFGHEVPAVVLFDLLDSGNIGAMSAYANILVVLAAAIVFGFQKLLRSEFAPSA